MKKLLISALVNLLALHVLAQEPTISILGVGDVMLGTDLPSRAYLPANNNCQPLLASLKDILSEADISFANLEGAFSDDAPAVKKCSNPDICYVFRTPTAYFRCMIDAGFDVFSLANNHSGDLGNRGLTHTIQQIENAGLQYAGLLSHPTCLVERKGLKIGFAAFAPNNGTCNINQHAEARRIVEELDQVADIVVVSFHGGAEGSKQTHVPRRNEIFHGENRGNVHQFAHEVIDAGADLVIGHGPHVPRGVELYKDRLIAYSLGNFCTYSRMNIAGISGYAPILRVELEPDGRLREGQIISAIQRKGQGTFADPNLGALKLMKTLSAADFPESRLQIDDQGKFKARP